MSETVDLRVSVSTSPANEQTPSISPEMAQMRYIQQTHEPWSSATPEPPPWHIIGSYRWHEWGTDFGLGKWSLKFVPLCRQRYWISGWFEDRCNLRVEPPDQIGERLCRSCLRKAEGQLDPSISATHEQADRNGVLAPHGRKRPYIVIPDKSKVYDVALRVKRFAFEEQAIDKARWYVMRFGVEVKVFEGYFWPDWWTKSKKDEPRLIITFKPNPKFEAARPDMLRRRV